ncbi:MAG TPA: aspartate carbamoyltransferase [Gammaproteobacteria bacterium]|jgi:DNA topoisomerase IB
MRHGIIFPIAVCFMLGTAIAAEPVAQKDAPSFIAHNSTHAFQRTTDGGIQQIVAKDPNDKALVSAIRTYLETEAVRFGNGDYLDHSKAHGKAMPGTLYLKAIKPSQIAITYRDVPGGAAVDYAGRDTAAVDAIHKWFDAATPSP